MSCHDIGRGMNRVVKTTISLFDKKKISRESAVKIIACCRNAIYWCDGNEGEATDYIRRCRCGKCLRLVPEGEKLYSVLDLPDAFYREKIIDMDRLRIASDGLCEQCFDESIQPFCDDTYTVDALKKHIEEWYDEEDYLSDGEHPNSNNHIRWGKDKWYD